MREMKSIYRNLKNNDFKTILMIQAGAKSSSGSKKVQAGAKKFKRDKNEKKTPAVHNESTFFPGAKRNRFQY